MFISRSTLRKRRLNQTAWLECVVSEVVAECPEEDAAAEEVMVVRTGATKAMAVTVVTARVMEVVMTATAVATTTTEVDMVATVATTTQTMEIMVNTRAGINKNIYIRHLVLNSSKKKL